MTTHERLEQIAREVLGDDALVLTDETTAEDVPGWDSLAHVNLMFTIEQEFGVAFSEEEFTGFANVGELKRLVDAKAHA